MRDRTANNPLRKQMIKDGYIGNGLCVRAEMEKPWFPHFNEGDEISRPGFGTGVVVRVAVRGRADDVLVVAWQDSKHNNPKRAGHSPFSRASRCW